MKGKEGDGKERARACTIVGVPAVILIAFWNTCVQHVLWALVTRYQGGTSDRRVETVHRRVLRAAQDDS